MKLRLPVATDDFDLDSEAGVVDVSGGVWGCLVDDVDLGTRRVPRLAQEELVDVAVEGDAGVATSSTVGAGLRLQSECQVGIFKGS